MLRDREIDLDISIDITSFLERTLEVLDDHEMIEIIKYIDSEVSDIDFTGQVYKYFEEQVRLDNEANIEDESENDDEYDVDTIVSIIVKIIKASGNNNLVIDGILDYIHEIEDNK